MLSTQIINQLIGIGRFADFLNQTSGSSLCGKKPPGSIFELGS
jgi:hypothetical protein